MPISKYWTRTTCTLALDAFSRGTAQVRVLVVDDKTKAQVQAVLDYAKQAEHYYVIGADHLPKSSPPGDNQSHVADLSTFRSVFSMTLDEGSGKVFRHLSISVPGTRYPNVFAALTIAELFGFIGWDGKSESIPDGWLAGVSRVDQCVTFLQEVIQ